DEVDRKCYKDDCLSFQMVYTLVSVITSPESTRPDTLKYGMILDGKHIEMHLEKTSDFITDDYTETQYASDGTPVVTKPDGMGKIMNDRKSVVSVSTCDGLRGYFQTAEQKFIIEPLSDDPNGDHAVIKYENVVDTPRVCGVTNTTWHHIPEGFPGISPDKPKARMSGQTMLMQKKYNEVILVVDNRMYVKMDKNVTQVRQKIFGILNFVNADHSSRAIAVGATLAHEMGHNLGMNHDNSSCACAESSCIMPAVLSYNIPHLFTNCSLINFDQFLKSRNPDCLLNKPQANDLLQPAVCGNGFQEIGEECDCGNVTIADVTLMCRPKHDECDLPEYCTGNSTSCPEDVFSANGLPCKNNTGYCYNGQCPRRDDQCIRMWGSGAVVGGDFCYAENKRGVYYAYCSRPTDDQFIGCQEQDIMCGKLFCDKGQDMPNYGRSVTFSTCKATFYAESTQDFGQVDTGTKCGDKKVCNMNQCVSLDVAYSAANCSAKCNGNR
ncbi:zinc metalloproteinase-disintegrin-like crotastatin, partial [Clarias magur]